MNILEGGIKAKRRETTDGGRYGQRCPLREFRVRPLLSTSGKNDDKEGQTAMAASMYGPIDLNNLGIVFHRMKNTRQHLNSRLYFY